MESRSMDATAAWTAAWVSSMTVGYVPVLIITCLTNV